MANSWNDPSQGGSASWVPQQSPGQANAWQNQWTPTMQQQAINYSQNHPQWQGYQQIMAGSTPAQIMAGTAPGPGSLPGTAASGPSSIDAIWSLLQNQNAPENQAIDTLKQQLGLDIGNETKLTGLKQSDLRASTDIQLARANKMLANTQAHLQNIGQERGFVGQLYNQANKAAGLEYGKEREALLSDATARGAVNAHGTVGQFQNQYSQFTNTLAGNTTQRNKSLADLALQEKDAQNTAQQYGLDKQALMEKLHNGIQQLGIQGQIDLGSLFRQAQSLDAQKAALAQGMISQIVGLAEGNPQLMDQLPGFTTGGIGFSHGGQGNSVAVGGRGVR